MSRLFAIIALVAVALIATAALGARRWRQATRDLVRRLQEAPLPPAPHIVSHQALDTLPLPVARYLRAVLPDGMTAAPQVTLTHTGQFNSADDREAWRSFTSRQWVTTTHPGFVWDAAVAMAPGVTARVHDAYVHGEGILHATVHGLVTVMEQRDRDQVARGELMRWLAESPWYPSVLLPGGAVRWEPVDQHSARATLVAGPHRVVLSFSFGADGMIERVTAEDRGRAGPQGVVPTRWEGRFWNYAERAGVRVPLDGEVAWLPADAPPHPYWRGHLESLAHLAAPEDR